MMGRIRLMTRLRQISTNLRDHLKRLYKTHGPVRPATVIGWGLVAVLVEGVALWAWYRFQVDLHELPVRDRWDLGLKAGGGVVVVLGFALTAWRISVSDRQAKAAEQQVRAMEDGQVTERFTKAVEQLASDKEEIRLGGIYSLERIARDSEKDHWTVMEILAAFLRKNSPALEVSQSDDGEEAEFDANEPRPQIDGASADALAAIAVIGRRERRDEPRCIDLRRTNLAGADLFGANLERANLERAVLVGANLEQANLGHAILAGADLKWSVLKKANLEDADLTKTDLKRAIVAWAEASGARFEKTILSGAMLAGAHFEYAAFEGLILLGTYFTGAHLDGAVFTDARVVWVDFSYANLSGANLGGLVDLTEEQLSNAKIDRDTVFPGYLEGSKERLLMEQEKRKRLNDAISKSLAEMDLETL